jgi:UDP-N-acetylmuramoyl-L-alanyl-D-glutamate--2,6-diaminopimelate ligase
VSDALRSPTIALGELLAGCDGASFVGCDASTIVDGLVVDSRAVVPGVAFVALRGHTNDAHAFVPDVVARGAGVVIVERGRVDPPAGAHVWLPDTAAALPVLAANAWGRPADALVSCGVTGTNGKTTTAHLVAAILGAAGLAHARLGTTGNWLVDREEAAAFTTPFPLELHGLLARARSRGATHLVMEVSSHGLAQGRVRPLQFAAVGLTSFSQDHLDFHASMDDYLAAKCMLPRDHLRVGGTVVAAVDDGGEAAARFLAAPPDPTARRWRASRGADAQAEILATRVDLAADGTRADVRTPAGALELSTPLVGSFNLDNVLVATGLALGLGASTDAITRGLASCRGAPGRLEPVTVAGAAGPRVLVDYAHTPDAVARTLAVLRPLARGRLIVLLGCGGDRDPLKRPLMGATAARLADVFWATSDNPRTEDPEAILGHMLAGVAVSDRTKVIREPDRAAAIAGAIERAEDADIVLVAGKGHEDYQVVGTTKSPFDDREHARAALRERARSRA